jgi:hypothetical protein
MIRKTRGNVDKGQKLGGVLGLVALLSAFLLPFSSIAEGPGGPTDSLLAMFKLFITTLPRIQAVGLTQLSELAYVYMVAFSLIILAGVLGSYPRWSGFLGLVGMFAVTVAPFAIFSQYNFGASNYGAGFWAIWATSLLTVFAAIWSSRERKKPVPVAPPASDSGTMPT